MAPFSPLPPAKAREKAAVAERLQVVNIPLNYPLDSARPRTEDSARLTTPRVIRGSLTEEQFLAQLKRVGAAIEQGRPGEGAALYSFSPVPCVFSCERVYEPARLSRAFSRRASGKRSGA